jgi:hypothetical protein
MSAVLLLQGHEVTLFLSKSYMEASSFHDLRAFILKDVPCDAQLSTSSRLRLVYIPMNHYYQEGKDNLPCDQIPKRSARIHCAIQEAASFFLTDRLQSVLQVYPVDVLLLDAGQIAGQLAAESLGISVVALLDPNQADDLLVRSWIQPRSHDAPWWGFVFVFQRMVDLWEEVEWTSSFVVYNRLRRRLGLPPVRTIGEIWDSLTVVLTKPRPTRDRRIVVIQGPLVPPCQRCDMPSPLALYPKYDSRVLVNLVESESHNGMLRRDVLKAFWMAHDSLSQWPSACKQGNSDTNCSLREADFGVVRMGPTWETFRPFFMALLPAETTFLSALAYLMEAGEEVLLVVVHAHVLEDQAWLHDLGPPILAIDEGMSVHDLATQILAGLHRKNVLKQPLRTVQGTETLRRALLGAGLDSGSDEETTWGPGDDAKEDASSLVFWWLAICLALGFLYSAWEEHEAGVPWDELGEAIWNQITWHEVKIVWQHWKTWVLEELYGASNPQAPVVSPVPSHRRRRTTKKKQA